MRPSKIAEPRLAEGALIHEPRFREECTISSDHDPHAIHRAKERQRILAARGWEGDPERRRVIRELLEEQLRHAYLWSYARHRGRDRAIARTRESLLRSAHSLGRIPDACSFGSWLFLTLAHEGGAPTDPNAKREGATPLTTTGPREDPTSGCPEPSHVLAMLDALVPVAEDPELLRHVEGCRSCVGLQNEYRSYRSETWEPTLIERARWPEAERDLLRFVAGYFGDDAAREDLARPPLQHRAPRIRLSVSRIIAAIVGAGVLSLLVLLGAQYLTSRAPERSGSRVASTPRKSRIPARPESSLTIVPPPGGPRLEHFSDTHIAREGSTLRFDWPLSPDADRYRVCFFTARLDTLYHSTPISGNSYLLPITMIRDFRPDGQYLYRVDAYKHKSVVATSGYVPFTAW